jgi:hypothetical protein
MNAPAAPLFWSHFGRPQPDDECISKLLLCSIRPAQTVDESSGLSPTMNAAAASFFWARFRRPQPGDEGSQKLCQIATKTLLTITAKMVKTTKINLKKSKSAKKR